MLIAFLSQSQDLRIASAVFAAKKHVEHVLLIDRSSADGSDELAREAGAEVMRAPSEMSMSGLVPQLVENCSGESVLLINLDKAWPLSNLDSLVSESIDASADISVAYQHLRASRALSNGRALEDLGMGEIDLFSSLFISPAGMTALIDLGEGSLNDLPDSLNLRVEKVRFNSHQNDGGGKSAHKRLFELLTWMLLSGHPLVLFGIPGLILLVTSFYLLEDIISNYESIANVHIRVTIATVVSTVLGLFSVMAALTFYILGKQIEFVQTNSPE